jgi:hypothetical protein
MCTVLLPPVVHPIEGNKYIISKYSDAVTEGEIRNFGSYKYKLVQYDKPFLNMYHKYQVAISQHRDNPLLVSC